MDSNGTTSTKRVELEDGQWAEVRRMNGAVLRHVRNKAHERKRELGPTATAATLEASEDPTLETLDGLPLLIKAWSFDQPITPETVEDSLQYIDIFRLWACAKGVDVPNPLSPSSAGTPTKGTARARRRSNG